MRARRAARARASRSTSTLKTAAPFCGAASIRSTQDRGRRSKPRTALPIPHARASRSGSNPSRPASTWFRSAFTTWRGTRAWRKSWCANSALRQSERGVGRGRVAHELRGHGGRIAALVHRWRLPESRGPVLMRPEPIQGARESAIAAGNAGLLKRKRREPGGVSIRALGGRSVGMGPPFAQRLEGPAAVGLLLFERFFDDRFALTLGQRAFELRRCP